MTLIVNFMGLKKEAGVTSGWCKGDDCLHRAIPATLVLLLGVILVFGQAYAQQTVTDAKGRAVAIESAQRIISLGPDVTEILYALGAGDRIVAVDRSSRFPPETASKANVGYRRSLNPEGLVSLQPDLIVAAEDIGPPEAVDIIRNLPTPVFFVPEDNSAAGVVRKIDLIAAALGRPESAKAVTARVTADFADAADHTARVSPATRRKVVFLHGLARLSAAGGGTPAGTIIELAGGINPLSAVNGYKQLSEEALLTMAPDVIMMLADGKGGPTVDEVFSTPALKNIPAAKTRSLIVLEGPYMLGFGLRTAEAVRLLSRSLYPGN